MDDGIEAQGAVTFLQPPSSRVLQQTTATKTAKRPQNDPLTAEEISLGLEFLELGPKSKIKKLQKKLLLHLCLLKNLQANEKMKVPELIQILENWVRRAL